MSYLALYRKYRPYTFSDVVGQQHIVKTLVNQISTSRLNHAYLFTGSRGTGKTSIAKIFARAVNCESPINGSACGNCPTCQTKNNLNILELDAASHNGVENIRNINEDVYYTPSVGKYKVYIIDEVHMLSVGAFNALLKTLEEPPAHAIFILATTDPQKIPVTILSRCQRFDFKRLTADEIDNALNRYAALEEVTIDHDAINYIAELADGGMRDALSILEQCISFYWKEPITVEKVQYLVGAVDKRVLFQIFDAILHSDIATALDLFEEVLIQGRSIKQFTDDLILHGRNLIISKISTKAKILDYSPEYVEKLTVQAELFSKSTLLRCNKLLTQLAYDLKGMISQRILFENTLFKLCEPQMDDSIESLLARIESLEHTIKQGVSANVISNETISGHTADTQKDITKQNENVPDLNAVSLCWVNILDSIKGTSMWHIFNKCTLELIDNRVCLIYPTDYKTVVTNLLPKIHDKIIEELGPITLNTISSNESAVRTASNSKNILAALEIVNNNIDSITITMHESSL